MGERFSPKEVERFTKSREEASTDAEDIAKNKNEGQPRKILMKLELKKPETGMGVLQEEANLSNEKIDIESDVGVSNLELSRVRATADRPMSDADIVSGTLHDGRGNIRVAKPLAFDNYVGTLEGKELDPKEAKKLFKKLRPAIEKNQAAREVLEKERTEVRRQRIKKLRASEKTARKT